LHHIAKITNKNSSRGMMMTLLPVMLKISVQAIRLFISNIQRMYGNNELLTYRQKSQADIAKINWQVLMLWLLGHFWDHLIEIFLWEFLKYNHF